MPPELIKAPVVPDLFGHAIDARTVQGLHMEFGVYAGASLRRIRSRLPSHVTLYGFDSFKGLPESWNEMVAGTFATHIRPNLPNTEIIEGWFADTLPAFVHEHMQPVAFMHIDCDLYSSTKTVFDAFSRQIVSGTIILFDELFGYAGYEAQEYRALKEFGRPFECIGRWNAYRAAIRML